MREDLLPLQHTHLNSVHRDTAFTLPWEQTECPSYFANIPAREGLNEDWLLLERKSESFVSEQKIASYRILWYVADTHS